FTTAGVGDMSGDVFGNGMLLSPVTRLVAAFDHRDIFIDPLPDPAISHAERLRVFNLPRSSWQDYDKSLISQGGGVFSRSLKAIPLAPEVRALLDLDKPQATPFEVMTAILKARVDLLWFGGIGTYIRASGESDDPLGDRANEPIRVTGADVRDDRRGRHAGASQQLSADAGAFARRTQGRGRDRLPRPPDAIPRAARAPEPRRGVPAGRCGDRRAHPARPILDTSGTCRAARLRQADALR